MSSVSTISRAAIRIDSLRNRLNGVLLVNTDEPVLPTRTNFYGTAEIDPSGIRSVGVGRSVTTGKG